MATKAVLLIFAILSISLAVPLKKKTHQESTEIPCDPKVVDGLKRMGIMTTYLKCYTTRDISDDAQQSQSVERRSCCGPECEWMIVDAGIDPATVACPSEEYY